MGVSGIIEARLTIGLPCRFVLRLASVDGWRGRGVIDGAGTDRDAGVGRRAAGGGEQSTPRDCAG
jgi:hypothetical protein